jgi:hypothetical protein
MTLETTVRHDALDAMKLLPSRKPADPAPPAAEVRWDFIDIDRYEVREGDRVLGFIDVVGAVFVVLRGSRYARATETLQTLVFEDAIGALVSREA